MSESAPEVEVRRSARRKRTVSAYREGDKIVVLMPAWMSKRDEASWVTEMIAKVERAERRSKPTDDDLMQRAERLSQRYLHGLAIPDSVRWVTNQRTQWGSCTPLDRSIRLSSRMHGMPSWVVDYVLLHELAHLMEPNHTQRFWRCVDAYEHAERAKG